MTKTTDQSFVPPYNITLRTLFNLLDRMAEYPELPAVVDRSYLRSMSGSAQTAFLTAATDFGLIDAHGVPADSLNELVYNPEYRPRIVGEIVREHFSRVLDLGKQATAQQLVDEWRDAYGQQGETRRKAISFFLHAAEYSGIEVSPYWEKGVARTARATSGTVKSRRKSSPKSAAGSKPQERQKDSHKVEVHLSNDAGNVVVEIAFDPFRGSVADREFVFQVVDLVQQHQEFRTQQDTSVISEDATMENQLGA